MTLATMCAAAIALLCLSSPTFAQTAAEATSPSFFDDFKTIDPARWYISDGWANGPWQNCEWAASQLRATDGILQLRFVDEKAKSREYKCAELQTKQRFGYGVYEARMRTDSRSGMNAAFFSYIGPVDNVPHDEIDVEILTRDVSKASFNTYVSGQPHNGALVPIPDAKSTQMNDYAFVWEKDRIRWFINGKLSHETKGTADLPVNAQKIFFSLWATDTATDWLGPFERPDRPVTMDVDWVAFTALGEPCQFEGSVACKLD